MTLSEVGATGTNSQSASAFWSQGFFGALIRASPAVLLSLMPSVLPILSTSALSSQPYRDDESEIAHSFGGPWAMIKLDLLARYLAFFNTAILQPQAQP